MKNVNKLLLKWKEVLLITASVRIGLLALTLFIKKDIYNVFYPWVQWDGPHYIDIANNWYQTSGEQALWIVFYPLYPVFIKLFNFLVGDFQSSAIIVSIFFSFTASILLFEVTLLDFKKRIAFLSVWFLNIFPTAYFLQASYTESLFLTMSLATIYFYRKQKYFSSGIFGLLSSTTRVNGVLLLPLLFVEEKLNIRKLLTFIISPFGFLIYLLINYFYFGEFFYFTKPLQSNWYKHFDWPWVGIKNVYQQIPPLNDSSFYVYITEFISVIAIFPVAIYVFLKVRKSYGIYMILNLLLCISTSFVVSTPRYILILFPIYITLALIKSKATIIVLSGVSLLLLLHFSQLYVKGAWSF